MAKRYQFLSLDFSNFSEYVEKLDKLGANLEKVVGDAMEHAAETIQQDVTAALADANLPAHGDYHGKTRDTEASVIKDPKVIWEGSVGTVGLGFDKTKPGAGGFLTTGTPKMKPDKELANTLGNKKYASKINKQIKQELQEKIDEYMGG